MLETERTMSGYPESSQPQFIEHHQKTQLKISRFTIAYRITETAWLSSFDGMAWQSAFEPLLRQTVCFSKCEGLGSCDFKNRCLYQRLIVQDFPEPSEHAPPYTFYPQSGLRAKKWQKGDHFYVGLTLMGRACFFLDAFLPALEAMGRIPLGTSGGRVVLASITQHLQTGHDVLLYERGQMSPPHPPEEVMCPPAPIRIRVNLETPLRLRTHNGVVRVPAFTTEHFGKALEQRLIDLKIIDETQFRPVQTWPVLFQADLKWLPSKQPSRRGINWSPLNTAGLIGSFDLEGEDLKAAWPLLWQGQFINLGEEAHLGLGRYSLTL